MRHVEVRHVEVRHVEVRHVEVSGSPTSDPSQADPGDPPVPLADRVAAAVEGPASIPRGGRVVAAVSGGGDSVALVHLLAELAGRSLVTLAGVAHVNHRLRGPASDGDERFCRDLARRLGVPCLVESAAVADLARSRRVSVERAGHEVRHAFFRRAAAELGAARVALGHTIDDQAETVLLRLIRGAGAAGLSGMRPRTGLLVRPLLAVSRAELRGYLADRGIPFREDASNADPRVPRNRVRHELLPQLRTYSPRIVEALARQADLAQADDAWLSRLANETAADLVSYGRGAVEVDAAGLSGLPPALARRVVRGALARVAPGRREIGFGPVERVRRVAAGGPPRADLPGCRVERAGGRVRLVPREGRGGAAPPSGFAYRLEVPGEVAVPEANVVIGAEVVEAGAAGVPRLGPGGVGAAAGRTALVAASAAAPLAVRSWRFGDRYRPLGLGGRSRKLQDLFVDRKVPRAERARVPLVVDAAGRVVWVVGFGIGHGFRVGGGDESVLFLKVRPLGETL